MVKQIYSKNHYERLTWLALEIHKLWKNGLDVSSKAIQHNKKYRKYLGAAAFVGITWQEVLIAAGIPLNEVIKKRVFILKYSKNHYERLTELAIEAFKLWKNDVDISSRAIQQSSKYRNIYGAATSMGISWQEVLVAAGIPLEKVMKIKVWAKDHYKRLTWLALEIHKLWKNGLDVSSQAIQHNKKYRKYLSAATSVGITWQEVLIAAGIPLDEVVKKRVFISKYSKNHYERLTELAIEAFKLWKNDVDISSRAIQQSLKYRKIYGAATSMDISWQEILVAAGIPLEKVMKTRAWAKDHYERLTELALEVNLLWEKGMNVSSNVIRNNKKYRKYLGAAYSVGISWDEVLVAADIPLKYMSQKVVRKWSEDYYERLTELALKVHRLWEDGVNVSSNAIMNSKKYRKYIGAANNVGISWQEVLIAAGIPLDDVFKISKYSKNRYERLTELAIEVFKLWKNDVDISSGAIQQSSKYCKIISSATSMGISWQEVLVAAGIPLEKVMKKMKTREWAKDHYERLTELALEVNRLWEKGMNISSNVIRKSKKYRRYLGAAYNVGISWDEVLVAADIPLKYMSRKVVRKKWPKDHYKRLTNLALQVYNFWEDGVNVSSTAITNSRKYRKYLGAAYNVGISWQEVLIAAGIPLDEVIKKDQ